MMTAPSAAFSPRPAIGATRAARGRLLVLLLASLLPACATLPERPPLGVEQFEGIGPVQAPPSVLSRDGGVSGIVGFRLLWTFGETVLTSPADDGATQRPNTAALARAHEPLRTREPLDAAGAPFPLIRRTAAERALHEDADTPGVALRPMAVLHASRTRHYVLYVKSHVDEAHDPPRDEAQHVGLALIEPGQTVARRQREPLFAAPGLLPSHALHDGDFVYLYGPTSDDRRRLMLARAPRYRVQERDAYTFWNGDSWTADPAAAAPVLFDVPAEMSVSYNRHLRRYLAVHADPAADALVLRTANRPAGPWSEPLSVPISEPRAAERPLDPIRAAREHPHLASPDARRITVTFYRPPTAPSKTGQVILAHLTLAD